MKSFEKDIAKYTHKTRLRMAERHELRERILSYMEYHPLPKQAMAPEIEKMQQKRGRFPYFNTIHIRIVSGVFALLLVTGLPVAAEQALPGDVLYPFKTQVNEGIRTKLATSPYQKVTLETELIERRIGEAQKLENEGKLTKDVESSLSETVQDHANAAKQGIAELRKDNADEAAIAQIALGSALEVQSAVLDAQTGTSSSSTSAGIANTVKKVQADVESDKGSTAASFGGLMGQVETDTTRAYELLQAIDASTTYSQHNDIERRLDDISRKIEEAQQLHADGNDIVAVAQLSSSLAQTQKLIAFMTNINVSENVALNTLVPLQLTDEERTAIAQQLLDNVLSLQATVVERNDYIDDQALLDQVSTGLGELSTTINTATSSLQKGAIDTAETAIANAYGYATNLIKMTNGIEVPRSATTTNATSTDKVSGSTANGSTTPQAGPQGNSTPTTTSATASSSAVASTAPTEGSIN
jgi:hypothetical protein